MRKSERKRVEIYGADALRRLEKRECHRQRVRGTFQGPPLFLYPFDQPQSLQFATAGTAATGTTSLSVPYPAADQFRVGSLLVLCVVNKYPTNAPSTPSGFTFVARQQGGAGLPGDDSGEVYTSVYIKTALGTETGNVSVTITGSTLALGKIYPINGQSSGNWQSNVNVSSYAGSDNTGGSPVSITTAAGSLVPTAQDLILGLCGFNTDGPTYSSISLSLSNGGLVLGVGTTTTDNNASSPFLQLVTTFWKVSSSATASGAMTFGATPSISDPTRYPAGAGVFLLIQNQ